MNSVSVEILQSGIVWVNGKALTVLWIRFCEAFVLLCMQVKEKTK